MCVTVPHFIDACVRERQCFLLTGLARLRSADRKSVYHFAPLQPVEARLTAEEDWAEDTAGGDALTKCPPHSPHPPSARSLPFLDLSRPLAHHPPSGPAVACTRIPCRHPPSLQCRHLPTHPPPIQGGLLQGCFPACGSVGRLRPREGLRRVRARIAGHPPRLARTTRQETPDSSTGSPACSVIPLFWRCCASARFLLPQLPAHRAEGDRRSESMAAREVAGRQADPSVDARGPEPQEAESESAWCEAERAGVQRGAEQKRIQVAVARKAGGAAAKRRAGGRCAWRDRIDGKGARRGHATASAGDSACCSGNSRRGGARGRGR